MGGILVSVLLGCAIDEGQGVDWDRIGLGQIGSGWSSSNRRNMGWDGMGWNGMGWDGVGAGVRTGICARVGAGVQVENCIAVFLLRLALRSCLGARLAGLEAPLSNDLLCSLGKTTTTAAPSSTEHTVPTHSDLLAMTLTREVPQSLSSSSTRPG